ncbi:MAG TPA: sugar ABC transporter ATP-binding protein [Actinomycetes bacterium]|nr:sugar ABC transporter ATP-binding protein [Actinomycetes bacterium]
MTVEPVLALQTSDVSKHFGATQALRSVDFHVRKASVHALLGRNGSGKSTLIKVLSGFHQADGGQVVVDGTELPPHHNPRQAHAAGLRFVHQDLGLVAGLSVAENLTLDVPFKTDGTGTIRWRRQIVSAAAELGRLGLHLDPRRTVATLGPVEQTMVAVARALQGLDYAHSVLVLDEPTARLPRSEVDRLLAILGTLKSQGVAIVYVTHRLDEVFAAADEVTILRDGAQVFTGPVSETDEAAVSRYIIGRITVSEAPAINRDETSARTGQPVLELRGISGRRVHDVSMAIHPGEVVAVTGLVGSGRSELGRLVYGIEALTAGEVRLHGHPMTRLTPRHASAAGMGYSPQERGDGLAVGLPIMENLAVTSYDGLTHAVGVSVHRLQAMAKRVIQELAVAPPEPGAVVNTLSGGNQQKVSLGKWTRKNLVLLVLDEPLQGIDVGAKAEIMRAIRQRAQDDGLAVLWLESDIEEVPKYADRVLVMRDGRISTELAPSDVSKAGLLAAVYDRSSAQGTGATAAGGVK